MDDISHLTPIGSPADREQTGGPLHYGDGRPVDDPMHTIIAVVDGRLVVGRLDERAQATHTGEPE